MLSRKAVRAAVQNARAIDWVRTHTIQDLEELAESRQVQGEDVRDISDLLDDLREIETNLSFEGGPVPEMGECA